jgi:hypothetical protein
MRAVTRGYCLIGASVGCYIVLVRFHMSGTRSSRARVGPSHAHVVVAPHSERKSCL